jgi:hypothetical protein
VWYGAAPAQMPVTAVEMPEIVSAESPPCRKMDDAAAVHFRTSLPVNGLIPDFLEADQHASSSGSR